MFYWPMRMNSLGKKATEATAKKKKEEILKEAVNEVRKNYPDFEPKYDRDFFTE
jgi:hypothetical protein